MMTRLLPGAGLAAFLAVGVASATAHAYNTKFCVKVNVTFTDSSVNGGNSWALEVGALPERTEDNWTTSTYAREARGAWFELKTSTNQLLMQGYLDDGFGTQGAGCTQNYTGTQVPYWLWIHSKGRVQSNNLDVYEPYKTIIQMGTVLSSVPQTGTKTITYSPTSGTDAARIWSGYLGGSFALYRHAGGETGNRYQFYLCQCHQPDGGPCLPVADDAPPGCICSGSDCHARNTTAYTWDSENNDAGVLRTSVFTNTGIQRKFLLIHEMGHLMAEFVANGVPMSANCTDDDHPDGGPCKNAAGDSHAFWSREFDKCAFGEAFADFYAADVWNDHNEDNCAFRYFITNDYTTPGQFGAFDCAGDDGPDADSIPDDFTEYYSADAVAYIEQCTAPEPPPNNYDGRGTEIDWTRVFWNVHTDGASPPSYTTIVQWIKDCEGVGGSNAYSALNTCAQARPQGDPLRVNWNTAKDVHTIDYSE